MKLIHHLGATVVSVAALLVSPISQAATSLFDSFESKNLSSPNGPSPSLNSNGFRWGTTNYTSVVGMVNGAATRVFTGSVINEVLPGYDFNCYSGTYCLRFRYPGGGYMAEQRFALGRHYSDVWFRYWIRVPKNFSHGSQNNKFAAFWTNVYDGAGDVTWQTRPTGSGNAKLVVQDGGTRQVEIDAHNNFINASTDRGRWMQVVIRMKPATSSTANNGTIQFYRRWSNEPNFTLLYNKTNSRFYEGGQGIHEGYLMGWANDPYKVETEWLIDDFTVSDESLLTGTTTAPSTPATSSPPSAPTLQVR